MSKKHATTENQQQDRPPPSLPSLPCSTPQTLTSPLLLHQLPEGLSDVLLVDLCGGRRGGGREGGRGGGVCLR